MEKEFVPYELALKLKAFGFDKPYFAWYQWGRLKKEYHPLKEDSVNQYYMREEDCTAPTFSQAFRWFREKHELFISIFYYNEGYAINDSRRFDTYEEAEIACLTKLIEIVESKSE